MDAEQEDRGLRVGLAGPLTLPPSSLSAPQARFLKKISSVLSHNISYELQGSKRHREGSRPVQGPTAGLLKVGAETVGAQS